MHLLTHGFFKAGLFLGAGSVMHGMNDETDMRRYGGLRTLMPVTFVTFGLGYLAIIGVPPFAGFFSKDAIIETAFAAGGLRGLSARRGRVAGRRDHRVLHDPGDADDVLRREALEARHASARVAGHHDAADDRARRRIGRRGRAAGTRRHARNTGWNPSCPDGAHEAHSAVPMWVMTVITLSVVVVGVAIAYRMYAMRAVPETAPADVSALTVAARNDLYGDVFNEAAFMRPGALFTEEAVIFDDDARRRGRRRTGHPGRPHLRPPAPLPDRFRPLVCAVHAGRCGAPGRRSSCWWGCVDMTDFPWLTVLWAVPMLGAAVIILLPSAARQFVKYAGVAVSLVVLAIAVALAVGFDPAGAPYQFVEDHKWIPSFGTGYILGLDGIALALVVLTAVLVPLLLMAGWNDAAVRRQTLGPGAARLRRADAGRRGHGADLAGLAGRPAVLRVLRSHAHPDVLPDRRIRRCRSFEGGGEVPAVQPVRRVDHAGRDHRPVRGDRGQRRVRRRARSISAPSSRPPARAG